MTNGEKIFIIKSLVEKFTKSIERELGVKKEISDDKATLEQIQEMNNSALAMPSDSGYVSYEEWITSINKEITSGINSLAKIGEQKVEIEALQYYLDNTTA
ncbi:MAG: hypothetical protein ACRC6K_06795 [Fusobacteriaceae bacterium]